MDCDLLGYDTVILKVVTNALEECIPFIFRDDVKMEVIHYSEMLIITYKTARHNPEGHKPKWKNIRVK